MLLTAAVAPASAATRAALGEVQAQRAGVPPIVPVVSDRARYVQWAQTFRSPLPSAYVHDAACPWGGGACALGSEVWLPADAQRFDLAHELGHVFDHQVLTDDDRARLTVMLDFDPGPWFHGTSSGAYDPSERFADAYAACALRMTPRPHGRRRVIDWETAYGYYPTARQHRAMCEAIAFVSLAPSTHR